MKSKMLLATFTVVTVASSFAIGISPSYAGNGNSGTGKPTSDELKNADKGGNKPGDSQNNGCFASGNTPKKCDNVPVKTPEPVATGALLIMSAGLIGSRLKRKFKSKTTSVG